MFYFLFLLGSVPIWINTLEWHVYDTYIFTWKTNTRDWYVDTTSRLHTMDLADRKNIKCNVCQVSFNPWKTQGCPFPLGTFACRNRSYAAIVVVVVRPTQVVFSSHLKLWQSKTFQSEVDKSFYLRKLSENSRKCRLAPLLFNNSYYFFMKNSAFFGQKPVEIS